MDTKVCVVCNTEKKINDNFYNKCRECKPCNFQPSMKRYYENEDKLSTQRKLYYEKNRDTPLAKSKTNNQYRNSHKQQIKDLSNKVEELTQAMKMLILKIQ